MTPTPTPTSTPLEVVVNGDRHSVPDPCDLAQLLARLEHREDGVATAVNGEFVARTLRGARTLRAGDQVNCFQLIVGG